MKESDCVKNGPGLSLSHWVGSGVIVPCRRWQSPIDEYPLYHQKVACQTGAAILTLQHEALWQTHPPLREAIILLTFGKRFPPTAYEFSTTKWVIPRSRRAVQWSWDWLGCLCIPFTRASKCRRKLVLKGTDIRKLLCLINNSKAQLYIRFCLISPLPPEILLHTAIDQSQGLLLLCTSIVLTQEKCSVPKFVAMEMVPLNDKLDRFVVT